MKGTDPTNPIELNNVDVVAGATHISQMGIDLITHFEGLKLEAYLDSANIPTIGIGSTFYSDGRRVKLGDKVTKEEAISLFKSVLLKFEQRVLQKIKRPLRQHEFDAAVSFCYNAGTGYNSGGKFKDYNIWANIQNKMPANIIKDYWENLAVTAGGKVLNGLVRRRKAEAWLYCNGELKLFD